MSLSTTRAALQSALETISGLTVCKEPPDAMKAGPVAINVLEAVDYHNTFSGDVTYRFRTLLLMGDKDSQTAHASLDDYITPSGTKSVRAAIEGYAVGDSPAVRTAEKIGFISYRGKTYIGAEFVSEVPDSGSASSVASVSPAMITVAPRNASQPWRADVQLSHYSDDLVGWQAILASMPSTGGKVVVLDGHMDIPTTVSSYIEIPQYVEIEGQGMYVTTFHNTGSGRLFSFVGNSSSDRKQCCTLTKLGTQGNVSAGPVLYAKFNYGPNLAKLVRFYYGQYGAQMDDNAASWTFDQCRFDGCFLAGTRLMVSTNPCRFMHCIWSSNTEEGLLIDGETNEIYVLGDNFNSNGKQAISILSNSRTITVDTVHFEDNARLMTPTDENCCDILIGQVSPALTPGSVWLRNLWHNGEEGASIVTRNGVTLASGEDILSQMARFRKLNGACYRIESGQTLVHQMSRIVDNVAGGLSSGSGTLEAM